MRSDTHPTRVLSANPGISQRAAQVADLAQQFAVQADQTGRLDPLVKDALIEAGLTDIFKPGGSGSVREFVEVCTRLAEGDMAAGWCNFVWGVHHFLVGLYPHSVKRRLWADAGTVASASLGPVGVGVREQQSFRVNGRWKFNSGCDYAEWLLLGFQVEGDQPHLGLFHHSEYAIDHASWDVLGLRGTGSKDVEVSDVLLPAERSLPFSASIAPHGALLILVIVAPVIGGARGLIEVWAQQLQGRTSSATGKAVIEQESTLLRYAESAAEVDAAEALIQRAANLLDNNLTPDLPTTLRIARDTAMAAKLCNRAARRVFEAAGGNALQASNSLNRRFRDVTAGCAHARLGWDSQALPWARAAVDSGA